jgi:hypothetical protein
MAEICDELRDHFVADYQALPEIDVTGDGHDFNTLTGTDNDDNPIGPVYPQLLRKEK